VSRHDGVVSIMRGFVPEELADLVRSAAANYSGSALPSRLQSHHELETRMTARQESVRAWAMPLGRPMEIVA
jgi:hypothetical protein